MAEAERVKTASIGSWPRLAPTEESASGTPASAGQSKWVISERGIFPLYCLKMDCRQLENMIKE